VIFGAFILIELGTHSGQGHARKMSASPEPAALHELRVKALLCLLNDRRIQDIEIPADFGIDEFADFKFDPESRAAGMWDFDHFAGPGVGKDSRIVL
jgi:hypothetical protein